MKRTRTFLVILTALPLMIVGGGFAQDNPPEPPSVADVAAKKLEALQEALDLSAEQSASLSVLFVNSITQHREIMEQTRALRDSVKSGVDTILTDEQLQEVRQNRRLRGALRLEPPREGSRGPRGFRGPPNDRGREGFRRIAEALELTDEQRADIRRLAGEEGVDRREAVDQVLTDEQRAQLETLRESFSGHEGRGGPGAHPGMRGRRGGLERFAEALEITDEQRAEIRRLIAEEDVNRRDALDQVLTDEQRARMEELREEHAERGGPRGPRGKHRGPQRAL